MSQEDKKLEAARSKGQAFAASEIKFHADEQQRYREGRGASKAEIDEMRALWEARKTLPVKSPTAAIVGVSLILREQEASKQWIEKELARGSKPGGLLEAVGKVGRVLFGEKYEWKLEEIEVRGDEVARAIGMVSPEWSDDMLWVFLQVVVVNRWGDALGPKELSSRPVIAKSLCAIARPENPGAGTALLDKLLKSIGIKPPPSPKGKSKRGDTDLRLPRALPADPKAALLLAKEIARRVPTLVIGDPGALEAIQAAEAALGHALPTAVRELYALGDGVQGDGCEARIAKLGELVGVQKDFRDWGKRWCEGMKGEEIIRNREGVDLRALSPLDKLVPFGTWQQSCNFLFVDPGAATPKGELPVFLFEHDGEYCKYYRPSPAALVAAMALEAYRATDPANEKIEALLADKPFKVLLA